MAQRFLDLVKGSQNFERLFGKRIYIQYNRVLKSVTEKGLCDKSDEKKPGAKIIINNLTAGDRERSTAELTNL